MSDVMNKEALRKMASTLRDEMTKVAEELDETVENVNIARVAGGSVGVVGGVISTIGFIAMPFTAGMSALVAGIGGGIVAAAGGLTVGTAKIIQMVSEKTKLKEISERWSLFCKNVLTHVKEDPESFGEAVKGLQANLARMGGIGVQLSKDIAAIIAGGGFAAAETSGAAAAATGAATGVATAGGAATRFAAATAAGSVGLNVILVGFSIFDIVDGSIELARKDKSKAGDALRKLAKSLDAFANTGAWDC